MVHTITDYVARGLDAAKPVSPNIGAGETGFYWATDTSKLYLWSGSGWVQANTGIGLPTPTVVQAGSAVTTNGSVTLGAAPTKGNLLVALGTHFTNTIAINAGWGIANSVNGVSTDGIIVAFKFALTGESTTQTPFSTASTGTVAVFEVQNAVGVDVITGQHDLNATPAVTQSVTTTSTNELILLLFATATNNLNLPTSRSGWSQDTSISSGVRAVSAGHVTAAAAGVYTPSATWAVNPTAVATIAVALF